MLTCESSTGDADNVAITTPERKNVSSREEEDVKTT